MLYITNMDIYKFSVYICDCGYKAMNPHQACKIKLNYFEPVLLLVHQSARCCVSKLRT